MQKDMLEQALALSTASTMDEFKSEVLQVYIDQREKEEIERRGGPVPYQMQWGRQKEFKANGYSVDGKSITIAKGSAFAEENMASLFTAQGYVDARDDLMANGTVKKLKKGKYVFVEEHHFPSFSTAASVIRGVPLNGRKEFKRTMG